MSISFLKKVLLLPFCLLALAACTPKASPIATPTKMPTGILATDTATASLVPSDTPTPKPAATSTPDTRLPPEDWQEWPVVPASIGPATLAIYRTGQALGNDPHAFSKIGDCEATPAWFLGPFDGKTSEYSLGPYTDLQAFITYFQGSFGRTSLAAGKGYSSANALAPLWADRKTCQANETPVACEVRVHRPSFALVMLGTNDVYHQDTFLTNMRAILDYLIQKGVVPILATKADNLEGDQAINTDIAALAYEYDLPLWNFWRAVQPLPNHGLQADGSHLTWAGPYFDDPARMQSAWPWRNLTALQVLDAAWRGVNSGTLTLAQINIP